MAVTGAYRTVSMDALCVVAGELPIKLASIERHFAYGLRRGVRFSVEGEVFNERLSEGRKEKGRLRDTILKKWQREWDISEKGRITKCFFPDVAKR